MGIRRLRQVLKGIDIEQSKATSADPVTYRPTLYLILSLAGVSLAFLRTELRFADTSGLSHVLQALTRPGIICGLLGTGLLATERARGKDLLLAAYCARRALEVYWIQLPPTPPTAIYLVLQQIAAAWFFYKIVGLYRMPAGSQMSWWFAIL